MLFERPKYLSRECWQISFFFRITRGKWVSRRAIISWKSRLSTPPIINNYYKLFQTYKVTILWRPDAFNILICSFLDRYNHRLLNPRIVCPICKTKVVEHSEFQDKICRMITIKQFSNNSPGFDVLFRPFFEGEI